jgi:UDP-4-amino-4,6-dideoxy-N-acetyl-beta-L-altrosamine transaminase
MIPYGRQNVSEDDIQAVVEVLRSDWLTQGPAVERFEQAVREICGAAHAVAVCNATAGLHLACRALGLGPGDTLWTSPNTFVASANCGLYCGASVDFVDIDPRTYNMSVAALSAKLEASARAGRLPKIVIPVHFGGQSCEMREIRALADRYGFAIIEDASHAIGGEYLGKPVGNCRYSDIAVFSFHPVKIVTTGEGGIVVTNDSGIGERIRRLRSHGITREPAVMEGGSEGDWYYQQVDLGHNYRLTDIQAALGTSQLRRLRVFVARRRALADRYDRLLARMHVTLPGRHPDAVSANHLYVIHVTGGSEERRRVFMGLRQAGVGVNVHYIPVHLQPYFRRMGFRTGDYPNAESYYSGAISLPLYFDLSDDVQDCVVSALSDLLNG